MKKALWIGIPVLILVGFSITVTAGRPAVSIGSITTCQFCKAEVQQNVTTQRVWWFQKENFQVVNEEGCCSSCGDVLVEVKWGRVIYCERCNLPRKYEVKRKEVPQRESGQYKLVPVTSGVCPKCKKAARLVQEEAIRQGVERDLANIKEQLEAPPPQEPTIQYQAPTTQYQEQPTAYPTREGYEGGRQEVAVQCSGITQKGTRCKRMTKNASGRCYQH